MEPVRSHASNNDLGPPELQYSFEDRFKNFSPPYSTPYTLVPRTENLPNMVISEWKPSKEEMLLLSRGESIYVAVFESQHPTMTLFVGKGNFGGPNMVK